VLCCVVLCCVVLCCVVLCCVVLCCVVLLYYFVSLCFPLLPFPIFSFMPSLMFHPVSTIDHLSFNECSGEFSRENAIEKEFDRAGGSERTEWHRGTYLLIVVGVESR
jgi:hypothetical protein